MQCCCHLVELFSKIFILIPYLVDPYFTWTQPLIVRPLGIPVSSTVPINVNNAKRRMLFLYLNSEFCPSLDTCSTKEMSLEGCFTLLSPDNSGTHINKCYHLGMELHHIPVINVIYLVCLGCVRLTHHFCSCWWQCRSVSPDKVTKFYITVTFMLLIPKVQYMRGFILDLISDEPYAPKLTALLNKCSFFFKVHKRMTWQVSTRTLSHSQKGSSFLFDCLARLH